jgi:hypothetical protein
MWGEAALLALIALAVRLPHLATATPWYDEFYHLLAARQLLVDGTFGIANGEYTRATLFTRLVAESLRLFGDGLAAGRVPALVAGTLWSVAVFAWFRHIGGAIAGWTAGLLFALDPGSVFLSQWVRFYSLHGLLVFVGAICMYHLVSSPLDRRRQVLLGVVGLASFAVARHLQQATLVALGAAGLWAGAAGVLALPGWLSRDRRPPRRRWIAAAAGLAVAAVGLWLVATGRAAGYWRSYTSPFFWMTGSDNDPRWFFWWLAIRYPTLWTLFPFAIALAAARSPRPALFSLVMFTVAFVVVSFGPAKQERYLYFAMPFFFGLWGLAAATLLPALYRATGRAVAAVRDLGLGARARPVIAGVCVLLALAFVASQNEAPRITVRMVAPGSGERPYRETDWASVLPQLQTLVDSADVVLSSYVLKSLYYFDRGDYHLSWTETAEAGFENGRPVEFARDSRTHLPTISTPESLEKVMACFQSGLILTERFHVNRQHLVPDETTAFIRAHTEEVPVPLDSWVLAFRWRHAAPPDPSGCSLPAIAATPANRPLALQVVR